jgi:hypothetical protein
MKMSSSSQNVTKRIGSGDNLTNDQRRVGFSCTRLVTFYEDDIRPFFQRSLCILSLKTLWEFDAILIYNCIYNTATFSTFVFLRMN